MKRFSIFITTLFLLLSCKKSLQENPLGQVAGGNALNTVGGLQAALVGAYRPMQMNFVEGFTFSSTIGVLMGSDEFTTHPASNKASFREYDQFNVQGTNGNSFAIWSGCYKAIQGANNIINNYQITQGDQAIIKQILGEAYFLRAFNYYWLVRLWGNIPLLTSEQYSASLLKIKSSPPADVYALIEKDLSSAKDLMADKPLQTGRASKGAALSLLADVYMTEGGWPINNQSKYALAAQTAKQVIDNKVNYGFDLVPDLKGLWTNLATGTASQEEVFTLHACGSCDWNHANSIFGNSCMPSDEGGWDDFFPELTFFNNFPAGLRKDVTFHTTIVLPGGGTEPWQNDAVKHPYYAKYRLPDNALIWQTSGTTPLMRYAQVLLIYAEAQARSESSANSQAYSCINSIRTRAGLPNLSGLSNSDFINATIKERSWEFAGEFCHWFDIVRLQTLSQIIATRDPAEIPIIGTPKYTLPLPTNDLNLNPGL
ncbi:RagB/SusD family nutrient uptake outer membrane protein [Mucilaginibacter ginsenosidivorax]|uniref:RagB/SusD family nutrient uptake outer membrane protein n=1 Tax=Mucilaginibacter ginsenosidivorax TaxID=862126 RepID=A0A5B8W7H7_9SPHI|nr:RagB/SusD family nutrient uptake outer membrane protein [Mucilaginibacter ginsenosidivorax]QEC78896.1 RagB/SusD family nutrient uptake outer membrane protein [Mucilaginibacter ginsenosidivorax]